MLLYVLYAIVAVIALGLGRAISSPNSFRIERSAKINASPERIASYITDFHKWTAWSPWEKLDPALKRTYSGAPSGTGAVYEWEGNNKAGSGRMKITDANPHQVVISLDFLKPFKASNIAEFHLTPVGDGTDVLWVMKGNRPFGIKVFGLFFNMDKAVGGDFEKGLAALKQVSEQPVSA